MAFFAIEAYGVAVNVVSAYIVREILKASAAAALLLLTLFNLFTFADELKDISDGGYGLKEILLYLTLTSPRVFYELLPSAALLGSLFVLGAMSNNREIVALRSAGLSVMGLIRTVLLAGMILTLIAVVVGEFIAPDADRTANVVRDTAKKGEVVMRSRYGLWVRDGRQFINVRQISKDGELGDAHIYELDDQRHFRLITHVSHAHYAGHDNWVLENVQQTEIAAQQVLVSESKQKLWHSSIDPSLLDVVVVKTENLSLYDLAMYVRFLKENNQKSQRFELAFWGRVINPLVTVVMLLVSTPFVIGFKRVESMGARMVTGVLFGIGFNMADQIATHLGLVYNLNPMLVAFLPSTLVLCGAVYGISRLR
ncbi:MAG: LPS export ABC transporter permease LptG [Gammaproteobacteria bacterium]